TPGTIASTGTSIPDSSGRGHSGTASGSPTYRQVQNPNSSVALQFNGNGDRIFIPDNADFALTQSLTLEAFINLRSLPSAHIHWEQILFRGDDRTALDPYI